MTREEARASLIKNAKDRQRNIIKPLWKRLINDGWTLKEIDEMDIHFYFSLFKEETVYIDQIQLF